MNLRNGFMMAKLFSSHSIVRKLGVFVLMFMVLTTPAFTAIAQDKDEQKAKLEAEYEQILKELTQKRNDLEKQKQKSSVISSEIEALEAEIRIAEQSIQAREVAIERLSGNIAASNQKIQDLSKRITEARESLAELIRETDKKDDFSIVEVILSSESISEFFEDVETFQSVKDDIQEKLVVIEEARILTKSRQEQLQSKKLTEEELKQVQILEKQEVAKKENAQQALLSQSKTKENFHQSVIERKKQDAAEIRAKLFALRDANVDINFGQALDIARDVSNYTGIRPAFLLAILTQESRIGQNVGRCNLESTPSRMWKDIMKPSRDIEPYKRIVKSLGISPETQPLSCPQSVGWGGAMGPAQFIPSTWEMYISRVTQATGSNPPNPWNPRDAFFASGLFLADLGAGAGTKSAEIEAAGRYFAGGNWRSNGMYYANSVQNIAEDIQKNKIDPLTN